VKAYGRTERKTVKTENINRIIGIRHRIKRDVEGKPRPTQIHIVYLATGSSESFALPDEQAEMDFVLGRYPVKWKTVAKRLTPEGDDFVRVELEAGVSQRVSLHHVLPVEDDENLIEIPERTIGLQKGDVIAMGLGGSGDYLAYAFARHGEEVGASVYRITPFALKRERDLREMQQIDDAKLLATLYHDIPGLFLPTEIRDLALIRVREQYRLLMETMKARIAAEQRRRQSFIGEVFCKPDGLYPQGGIEKEYNARKATSAIVVALETEEAQVEKRLTKLLADVPVFAQVFEPLKGTGPRISARLIAGIQDIRRFATDAKLKKYCGVHVMSDGTFVRRRAGEVADWSGECRQALFHLADQFNRQGNKTYWGAYLRLMKRRMREKYPTVEMVPSTAKGTNGKMVKKFTDGHIQKRAMWRTVTRFVEWLFKAWWAVEKGLPVPWPDMEKLEKVA
jgi:hypothetical protein